MHCGSATVTIRWRKNTKLSDVPGMMPQEHRRRGGGANAMFREMKQQIRLQERTTYARPCADSSNDREITAAIRQKLPQRRFLPARGGRHAMLSQGLVCTPCTDGQKQRLVAQLKTGVSLGGMTVTQVPVPP